MIKTIELTRNNLARIKEKEPFYLPDNLILDFESTRYDLSGAFISLQNGKVKIQQKLTSHFLVDENVLFPGVLNIGIHLYQNGKCIKSWFCLPLEIMETQHGTVAFDKLFEIEKRLKFIEQNLVIKKDFENLQEAYNKLAKSHNEAIDTISEIKEKFKEI
jgi:hypothetical protein